MKSKKKVVRRRYKIRQVCHNCRYFVREEQEPYEKYVDGMCTAVYPSDMDRRAIREAVETCCRFKATPEAAFRERCLRALYSFLSSTKRIKEFDGVREAAVVARDAILLTHEVTAEQEELFHKYKELLRDFGRQCEIRILEKQWNAQRDDSAGE